MIYVDSNVLLDVIQAEPDWLDWSRARLAAGLAEGPLLANDVVFAEISVSFRAPAEVAEFLTLAGVEIERTPPEALFLAARAHLAYRQRGGSRTGVLADFFIGAHANIRKVPLLTRDPRRYRTYFPTLEFIAP